MKKKLTCGLIVLFILLCLGITTVQASTYTVGNKTITFEKFEPEGIDKEIIGMADLKNNNAGIIFGNNDKSYHMSLDGTITEIPEEEWEEWKTKAWLDNGDHFYVEYLEPEIFSKDLPKLTFVEGTEDNAGSYAVKIGDTIVSGYDYEETKIVTDDWYNAGNVIIGTGKNKKTNEIDVWSNTKTTGKLTTILSEETEIYCDVNVLTLETFDDEGNGTVTLLDWDGNEIMSINLNEITYVWVAEFSVYNKKYYDVYIEDTSEVSKEYIYDATGNKVTELEKNCWVYDISLFGMLEVYSDNTDSIKIIEMKNGTKISPEIKCSDIRLMASTAEVTNTSADYLAPGKYYYLTYSSSEDDETFECYVMTISYTILDGANSSFDKKSENGITVRADGELDKLEGIYVDNEKLAEENYTLEKGSTIVNLKNEYLKTLETKEHTLKIKYLDGEVETKFTIIEENNGTEGGNNEETPKNEDDGTTAPGTIPNAGIGKYAIIIFALAVIVIASYIRVKKLKEIK